jgi:hypothetical protein
MPSSILSNLPSAVNSPSPSVGPSEMPSSILSNLPWTVGGAICQSIARTFDDTIRYRVTATMSLHHIQSVVTESSKDIITVQALSLKATLVP